MMNEFQRRILAEAAKFGGTVASQNDKMAKTINEAPAMSPSAVTSLFGYSKPQFEAKMRQLIQKMGFEKGITKMEIANNKMVLHFANAAKARDFIITFNGLTKRQSKGSPATINTSFDKTKAPAGTNAIVTVDFGMLKTEGLDRESHLFLMLESLHEQYITEGGVKAAIEDFMYDMLPKQAIAELKPIMKNQSIRGADLRNKVTAVLKKHKVPLMHIGGSSAQLVIDYFDTFHGESVEEQGETIEEGVRVMPGAEKMVKDDPLGGSSMVSSFRNTKKILEGKPAGSVMVVTKFSDPESMQIEIYDKADFQVMRSHMQKKPEAKVGSKGELKGEGVHVQVTVVAIKEQVEIAEQFKAGEKVKVPHKGKMVSGKIVRYDDGGTDKARQHGGGYVVDVGEPASVLVPKQKVQKEEVEIEEAKVKYLTGPGKRDSKRIIGIYTMQGKWIKDMNSEREAAAFVNKSWGESVEEEAELDEADWGGGFQTSREAQAAVQAGLKADAKKRQALIISALQKVIDGEMSKPAFKKLTGSSYADIIKLPFYTKKVKMKKEEVEDEEVEEAYAPLDTPSIIGAFTETTKKMRFEYRRSSDKWGISNGLPHEVCVKSMGSSQGSPSVWRAANVKGTVCYIAVDEDADGKPVLQRWTIRNHVKYVKAEETEQQQGEVIEEQDRVAVQGSKMVYVGQTLHALQSKSMMSGSVVKGERYKVATNAKGKVDLVHQAIGYRTAVRNVDATTIEALIKDRVLT